MTQPALELVETSDLYLSTIVPGKGRKYYNFKSDSENWAIKLEGVIKSKLYTSQFDDKVTKSILVKLVKCKKFLGWLAEYQKQVQESTGIIIRDIVDERNNCFIKPKFVDGNAMRDSDFDNTMNESCTLYIVPGFWVDYDAKVGGVFFNTKEISFK